MGIFLGGKVTYLSSFSQVSGCLSNSNVDFFRESDEDIVFSN